MAKGLRKGRGRPRKVVETGPDRGTQEQQMRRIMLVGDSDSALAEYPLGVMLARKIITQEQHNAGLNFARLYRTANPFAKTNGTPSSGEMPDDVRAEMERRYQAARDTLMRVGRLALDEVTNAAVFNRLPGWVVRSTIRLSDGRHRKALRDGLTALADAFEGKIAA